MEVTSSKGLNPLFVILQSVLSKSEKKEVGLPGGYNSISICALTGQLTILLPTSSSFTTVVYWAHIPWSGYKTAMYVEIEPLRLIDGPALEISTEPGRPCSFSR